MKVALVELNKSLTNLQIPYRMVLNVHDEFQIEVPRQYAEKVAELGVTAIKQAGVILNLRCPLDGEAKIGNNWYETH